MIGTIHTSSKYSYYTRIIEQPHIWNLSKKYNSAQSQELIQEYQLDSDLYNRLFSILLILYIYQKYSIDPFKNQEILNRLLINNELFDKVFSIEANKDIFNDKYMVDMII